MGSEMAAIDAEAADGREHVQGVLSNRIVGVIGQGHRFVRAAAAAPVDRDDPESLRNQRSDEVEPHAAREITVNEHDRLVARPPLRIIQLDLADIDEHESVPPAARSSRVATRDVASALFQRRARPCCRPWLNVPRQAA